MILDEAANNPQLEDILLAPIDKAHKKFGNQNVFESMFQINSIELMRVLVNWIIKHDKFEILIVNSDGEENNLNIFTQLLIYFDMTKHQLKASDNETLISLIFDLYEYAIVKGKNTLFLSQSSKELYLLFGRHTELIEKLMTAEPLSQHPHNTSENCALSRKPLNNVWSIVFESKDSENKKYYHKYKIGALLKYIHRQKSSSTLLCPLSRKPVVSLQLIPPEGF